MVSGNVHTVELKGLHNAQLNSLKLYTYKNGVKGDAGSAVPASALWQTATG